MSTTIIRDAQLATSYIKADGTRALTADWDMGAFKHSMTKTGATAATVYDGTLLQNNTVASLGNQMYSPTLRFSGKGWGTTLGSSQAVDYRIYIQPTQGTAPSGNLVFDTSIAGGAFSTVFYISATGQLAWPGQGVFTSTSSMFIRGSTISIQDAGSGNVTIAGGGGKVGIGITPTQILTLKAGTATAGTAPALFTAGTRLTVPIAGTIEYETNKFIYQSDSLEFAPVATTAATVNDALRLINNTAALVAAQQYSPALHFQGKGWGTTAGTSQSAEWRQYVVPVVGAVPTSNLIFDSSINGAGFGTAVTMANNGDLTAARFISAVFKDPSSGNIWAQVSGTSPSQALAIGNAGVLTTTFTTKATSGTIVLNGLLSTLNYAYVAKTALYTATTTDLVIDCTSGTFTVTLPTAVGIAGRVYIIKNSGVGTITMAGTSAQTFDGVTSPTLATKVAAQYQSDGANWIKIN